MDSMKWAFQLFDLAENVTFHDANLRITTKCSEMERMVPEELHTARYARDIVFSILRCRDFSANVQYNSMFVQDGEHTSFQSLLLFLLCRLKEFSYRRQGDAC